MKDKVFSYEINGKSSFGVRHFCLKCDKPILIEIAEIKENALFFCTCCGLDSRMDLKMVAEAKQQLATLAV